MLVQINAYFHCCLKKPREGGHPRDQVGGMWVDDTERDPSTLHVEKQYRRDCGGEFCVQAGQYGRGELVEAFLLL